MSSSINIFKVVVRHFTTFKRTDSSGNTRVRKLDVATHIIVPLAGAICTTFLPNQTWPMSDLIAGMGVLSGALFALVVLVFELQNGRSRWVGDVQRSEKVQDLVDQLFHNAMYATIVAVTSCAAVVVFSIINAGQVGNAIVALLVLHLILTCLMCAKALSQAYVTLRNEQDRLEQSQFSTHP